LFFFFFFFFFLPDFYSVFIRKFSNRFRSLHKKIVKTKQKTLKTIILYEKGQKKSAPNSIQHFLQSIKNEKKISADFRSTFLLIGRDW